MPSRTERAPNAARAGLRSLRPWLAARLRRGSSQKPLTPALRRRRSDLAIAGLGIALGFGCALFPWYIFFNQEKFGIRALEFEGNGDQAPPVGSGSSGTRLGAEMPEQDIPSIQLDLFAVGTVAPGDDGETGLSDQTAAQPFPGQAAEYTMVFAVAGRALLADDAGMWVVQRGSLLPDNSKVAAIEQRDGRWVLVTSTDKLVELSTDNMQARF